MTIRVLMLDIGGVFYRGWPAEDFWPRWEARLGVGRPELEAWLSTSEEARLARLGAIAAEDYYARAGARHGADAATFRRMLEEAYLSEFNAPLAEAVRGLAAAGVPVWALTNSLSPEAVWMAREEMQGLFRGVVSSCECGVAKPDAAIFALAAERAGAAPAEILFVDDAESHVAAARAAGFEAVVFEGTEGLVARLAQVFGTAPLPGACAPRERLGEGGAGVQSRLSVGPGGLGPALSGPRLGVNGRQAPPSPSLSHRAMRVGEEKFCICS